MVFLFMGGFSPEEVPRVGARGRAVLSRGALASQPASVVTKFPMHPNFFRLGNTAPLSGKIGFATRAHRNASYRLLLFRSKRRRPFTILPFPGTYHVNSICSVVIVKLSVRSLRCNCHVSNPCRPRGNRVFSGAGILLSPCTGTITNRHR